MKEEILIQFDETNSLYTNLGDKCIGILKELLVDNNIQTHQISARTKNKNSLSKKIDSKKNKYKKLSDITDICGIRVITYLESDVNKVAELIEKEFEIDKENSIDKRNLKSDQFGYRSLHYVVSFDELRSQISEFRKYNGLKFEIQVRSILQHAWAEIEHDLGYKGEITIPEHFKRNFNRLSALLETADIEFDRLKKDLNEYEHNVTATILTFPNEVLIDQASLSSFVKNNEIFEKARKIISRNTKCEFFDSIDYVGELERFSLFEINTIGELEQLVTRNQNHYLSFVDNFTKPMKENRLNNSIPLFYFQHYLACSMNSEDFLNKYFNYGTLKMLGDTTEEEFLKLFNESKDKNI